MEEEQLSLRKACAMVGIPRSSYRYKAKPKDDTPVEDELRILMEKHADIGFWESDATYRYYANGPLQRTVLGRYMAGKLVQVKYPYTSQLPKN